MPEKRGAEKYGPLGKYNTNDFIDWLRSKPTDQCYYHRDPTNCAIAQFAKAKRIPSVLIGWSIYESEFVRYEMNPEWHNISNIVAKGCYDTFGRLLEFLTRGP